MSFALQFSGHVDPPNPETDAKIRRLARAFSDTLRAAGVEHSGSVDTPTGGGTLIPQLTLIVTNDGTLHTAGPDIGGSPTTGPK